MLEARKLSVLYQRSAEAFGSYWFKMHTVKTWWAEHTKFGVLALSRLAHLLRCASLAEPCDCLNVLCVGCC